MSVQCFDDWSISIYNSSNMCVCVFVCDRRSDLIETCQEYCRGPADVPFRGLISIGRTVPKLRPFYCFFSVEKVYTVYGSWRCRSTFSTYHAIFSQIINNQTTTGPIGLKLARNIAGALWMCLFKVWYQSDERFPSYGHVSVNKWQDTVLWHHEWRHN